jgi:hypothetical protein
MRPSKAMPELDDEDATLTELGYPALNELAKEEPSSFFIKPEEEDEYIELGKEEEEYIVLGQADTKKKDPKKGYVHINQLNLPDPVRKTVPRQKFSYEVYYEEPRATFNFSPIEDMERQIDKTTTKKDKTKQRATPKQVRKRR